MSNTSRFILDDDYFNLDLKYTKTNYDIYFGTKILIITFNKEDDDSINLDLRYYNNKYFEEEKIKTIIGPDTEIKKNNGNIISLLLKHKFFKPVSNYVYSLDDSKIEIELNIDWDITNSIKFTLIDKENVSSE